MLAREGNGPEDKVWLRNTENGSWTPPFRKVERRRSSLSTVVDDEHRQQFGRDILREDVWSDDTD